MNIRFNPLKSQAKLFVTSGIVLSSVVLSSVPSVAAGPWRLAQTFLNPSPEPGDYFGYSVALSGNNVLIGANFGDTGAIFTGAAYLFERETGNLERTFRNPTPQEFDLFGNSVSLAENNVLIGTPYDDSAGADNAGAVYLFDAVTGNRLQTFLNPTPEDSDYFGFSVSMSGNNALIGAFLDNTGAENAGSAYLYDVATGSLLQTFRNPTPEENDYFGYSVSISGNNVLIGAYEDNTGGENAGAAYLFDALTGNLLQTFRNPTPKPFDSFGTSVSISGNNVLIGAENDDTGANLAGAAYLFNGETGSLLQTFFNPTPEERDNFGYSVSISNNNVLIGGRNIGEAYLFDGVTGSLLQTFPSSTPNPIDFVGDSVSISGDIVLIGAPYDNTGADNAGAAYLYKPVPEPLTILGAGSAAVLGCFYKRRLAKKH